MAYSIDGTDIVINGFENGISDNPYKGLNDMRGVNIISVPGEASVSFAQTLNVFPNVTANLTDSHDAGDTLTITVTAGTLVNGQAIKFAGASLPTNVVAGNTYWVLKVNATTIKLYDEPTLTRFHGIGSDGGTGTMASINIGEIRYFEKTVGVALDDNGRAWWQPTAGGVWTFLGNGVYGSGRGIFYYKQYLFVITGSRISYLSFPLGVYDPTYQLLWVNEWNPTTGSTSAGTIMFRASFIHEALVGQDDVVYICDGAFIDSLFEKALKTFDPADNTTYTWAGVVPSGTYTWALKLPSYDTATCLEELGKQLMIGGTINYIYPWDRTSTSFTYPIKIADNYTFHLLTVNTNMYIFAGRRGRIYVTNSSQANLYAKIPDHISGIEPIFEWKNCCYNKNQIYFGVSAKDNAQNAITNYVGLWAIDITTNALRVVNLQSNVLGTVTAVYAYNSVVSGFGLAVAWTDYTTSPDTYGIDKSSEVPYDTYIASIETDLIPVGQFLKKATFSNLEIKLTKPLVSGEGVRVSARNAKDGTYVVVGETLTVGTLSDAHLVNFDLSQWLQFKIELKSTATAPSYTRFYELRLRT